MQVKKQELESDMEQPTGFKLGREYVKAVYCHPAYLTYVQSTSCEMPGWMNHKLESRLQGEIPATSDIQIDTTLRASLVAQLLRIHLQCGRPGFHPWVGKLPWRRKWQPTPVFWPGECHGRRSLVDYSPWGCRVGHD